MSTPYSFQMTLFRVLSTAFLSWPIHRRQRRRKSSLPLIIDYHVATNRTRKRAKPTTFTTSKMTSRAARKSLRTMKRATTSSKRDARPKRAAGRTSLALSAPTPAHDGMVFLGKASGVVWSVLPPACVLEFQEFRSPKIYLHFRSWLLRNKGFSSKSVFCRQVSALAPHEVPLGGTAA